MINVVLKDTSLILPFTPGIIQHPTGGAHLIIDSADVIETLEGFMFQV